MFDAHLIEYVEKKFQSRPKIEMLTKSLVLRVETEHLVVQKQDEEIIQPDGTRKKKEFFVPYGMLVWSTGNKPRDLINNFRATLEGDQNNKKGLAVDSRLRVKGTKNIWALGDCAASGFPATAQVAAQQGRYLGNQFNQLADHFYEFKKKQDKLKQPSENQVLPDAGNPHEMEIAIIEKGNQVQMEQDFEQTLKFFKEFSYSDIGSLAYVGGNEAIAEFKRTGFKFKGTATYFLWRSVYFSRLLSPRNRMLVSFDWIKSYLYGRDISRV